MAVLGFQCSIILCFNSFLQTCSQKIYIYFGATAFNLKANKNMYKWYHNWQNILTLLCSTGTHKIDTYTTFTIILSQLRCLRWKVRHGCSAAVMSTDITANNHSWSTYYYPGRQKLLNWMNHIKLKTSTENTQNWHSIFFKDLKK